MEKMTSKLNHFINNSIDWNIRPVWIFFMDLIFVVWVWVIKIRFGFLYFSQNYILKKNQTKNS